MTANNDTRSMSYSHYIRANNLKDSKETYADYIRQSIPYMPKAMIPNHVKMTWYQRFC